MQGMITQYDWPVRMAEVDYAFIARVATRLQQFGWLLREIGDALGFDRTAIYYLIHGRRP